METKAIDFNAVQLKLSKVRKSCVTPEQKSVYRRYAQLYRNLIAKYNNDYQYAIRIDAMMLLVTSALLAAIAVTGGVMLIAKILSH